MNKPFAIQYKPDKKFIEFFEFPEQAKKYIKNELGDSPYFGIVDLRKRK